MPAQPILFIQEDVATEDACKVAQDAGYAVMVVKDIDKTRVEPGDPVRRAYSREEIIDLARAYMVDVYGTPKECPDRDAWHTKLGLMVSFLHSVFPSNRGDVI